MLPLMSGRWGVLALGTMLGWSTVGCGGASDTTDSSASGAGQGGGATAGSGGTATLGGSAGAATGAGAGQGGASGAPSSKACQGSYGPLTPLFTEASMFTVNGPSVTSDELLLFYSVGDNTVVELTQAVMFRQRASVADAFGPAQTLPELANVCLPNQHVNPDISEDGLTLYVTCTASMAIGLPEGPSQLRVARRNQRSASFVLDAEPVGSVLASAGLSADELTAYTGGEVWGTAPQLFTRAAKSEKFGEAKPVPGFTLPLNSPDISADGLTLFGAAPSATTTRQLVRRATRASVSENFGAPTELDFGLPDNTFGAPNVTPSCSLYVVMVAPPPGGGVSASSVQLARPQ